ncbi:MAG: hypothetical protein AVDCRST_MAG91-2115 [uncultured Sphingomonadaceae bacterium]|uniref:Uncharacterized protein n=1 Tax=uncultured Sphingomonadaceae bacterium TaxID=169976 RepID=A0A6J4TD89_9SPHN|nr:MAG: hypothetical protein AVDCRST_MAG91-2115 [uncultured Sphingomonadaceae bacterium]
MIGDDLRIAAAPVQPELTTEQAFKDLEAILTSIASSPSHYRNFAVHYLRCREALMSGQARPALPGFLVQCGTSDKFRDFITLFDASVQARRAFLDQALGGLRASLGWTRSYDIFDDDDF